MKKLEIGPGPSKLSEDWTTACITNRPHVDHTFVWGKDPLPFEDNTFDFVYSAHCLEHVPWHRSRAALKEAYRVLKTGGTLEIHVPDLDYLVQCLLSRKLGDSWEKYNNRDNHITWFASRMFSYEPDGANHKACFNEELLSSLFNEIGLSNILKLDRGPLGHQHGNINIGMTGQKL